jgi:uncharacterized membrane protein required for colicin V production
MGNWNGLDFFVFLIFFLNTVLGMSRGATKEIIAMMCLCAALIFTIKFTVPLAAFFNSSPLISDMVNNFMTINFMNAIGAGPLTDKLLGALFYCISLLICFVGVFSITSAVLHFAGFQEAFSFPYATMTRKVGGGLGFVRGYIFTLIFLLVLAHIFTRENNQAINTSFLTNSFFYKLFESSVNKLDQIIISQNPEKYRELFEGKNLYTPEQMFQHVNESQPVEDDKKVKSR